MWPFKKKKKVPKKHSKKRHFSAVLAALQYKRGLSLCEPLLFVADPPPWHTHTFSLPVWWNGFQQDRRWGEILSRDPSRFNRLSDVGRRRSLARCWLNTGHSNTKLSALLWPTGEVWSKELWPYCSFNGAPEGSLTLGGVLILPHCILNLNKNWISSPKSYQPIQASLKMYPHPKPKTV